MDKPVEITVMHISPDGQGHSLEPAATGLDAPQPGFIWVNLCRDQEDAGGFLHSVCRLDTHVISALLALDTRPVFFVEDDHLLLVLRGINLNPGADPIDMVSVRCWFGPQRVITVISHRVMAINDLQDNLLSGTGPSSIADFLIRLCERITQRMAIVFSGIEEAEDEIEERILTESGYRLRPLISALRRQVISLRRYLSPQRQALFELQSESPPWFTAEHRGRLRNIADRITRQVEDLDATRDRGAIAQDELESKLAEQLNKNMYLLSVIAAIFLPLGLISGLMGMNVSGIPGIENPNGFWLACLVLCGIAGVELWLLHRLHFI